MITIWLSFALVTAYQLLLRQVRRAADLGEQVDLVSRSKAALLWTAISSMNGLRRAGSSTVVTWMPHWASRLAG